MSETDDGPILFFDGVCGLCNRAVDFCLRHDRRGQLRFAPLQGETARQVVSATDIERLDTVVLCESGRLSRHSTAIVRLLWQLGGVWSLVGCLLWLVPRPVRNLGYRRIGGSRYRWFGRRELCRLPKPEERARMLP